MGNINIQPLTSEEVRASYPDVFIAPSSKIYPGVSFGKNVYVDDFCIIGYPSKGVAQETFIGDNAIIRSHTVIYTGNYVGSNFHAGHKANIRESNKIGSNVSLGTMSVLEHHIEVGDNVRIHTQAFIPEFSILEQDAWIGPNVVFTNARYPLSVQAKSQLVGPIIRRKAKIGANCTLLPGVEVGENAMVGAGSVVVRNVLPNHVVVGNPALFIGSVLDLPY